MKLKELKITDFKEELKYDFIFPIWATEQHGPFIPFGTDTYITDYIITEISKEFHEIIILPTLEYSRSEEHRNFFGTLWLTEDTLEKIIFDICNSLKDKARNIFIYSFHANSVYIDKFIDKYSFEQVNIINLRESNNIDCEYIEKNILYGPLDDHAGNSEISSMLVINKKLAEIPLEDYQKFQIENPFETDNLIEKSPNWIADNHSEWKVSHQIGQQILEIYVKRMIENIKHSLNK